LFNTYISHRPSSKKQLNAYKYIELSGYYSYINFTYKT
jgi:hypothetical protein